MPHRYANRGSKQIWLKSTSSGAEKRFATVQLTAYADGVPRVKPNVIFHGAGMRMAKEKGLYHPKVRVSFQPKAWVDERQFCDLIKLDLVKKMESGKLLLLVDAHGAQNTASVKNLLHANGIREIMIPPGCTGELQPLDLALIKTFKGNFLHDKILITSLGIGTESVKRLRVFS